MSNYNRLLCVDVEMTCWEGPPPDGEQPEMIALGIVDLRTDSLEIRREKLYLIKPEVSRISPFCSTLTGITPKEVAKAPPLADVFKAARKTFAQGDWCAWGRDDELIGANAARVGVAIPFPGLFHDLAAQVRLLLGLPYRPGLDEALARFDLDFEGQPHDALADARNLARLFIEVARRLR
jgi:inhibitor of KinA sporulation pathway (predicted exonuclease)